MDVLLVHGYNVTSTKTYGNLPRRLKAAGHHVKDVYLGKYVTLDDDITLSDLIRAFQAALSDIYGDRLSKAKFACVTHSTGALVLRGWVAHYFSEKLSALPLTHLIMLAPPTNGSRLAELGKSRLSRLRTLIGVEPGVKVLDALELGSQFQWDLNSIWMKKKLHEGVGFFTFVITGQWVDKKLWDVIIPATYERGSDGVVRAAGANLNIQKFTVRGDGSVTKETMEGVAFLIPPKAAHSDTRYGIMGSIPEKGAHPVLTALLHCLDVEDRQDYEKCESDFSQQTRQNQKEEKFYDGSHLDRYVQLVFRISDNSGNNLDDYAVELIDVDERGDQLPSGFFADRHKNEKQGEFLVYYLNYDRLSKLKQGRLGFRIRSIPNTTLIGYQDLVYIDPSSNQSILKPNQTTLIDVILNRRINKNVFRLTKNLDIQQISGKPGPEWID